MTHSRIVEHVTACGMLGLMSAAAAAQPGPDQCRALAADFAAADIELASVEYLTDDVAAHCDVRGTIRGNVGFAVMLPTEWNERFVMVGNGGKAGVLELEDAQARVAQGYAAATTNTGHDNTVEAQSGARFGTDPEMEEDFGYRAVHDTADAAKALVAAYYGAPQDYSYWVGCSTGGRQGLMEAQRYPEDFDGYVIGAPVYNYTRQQMTAPALLRPLYGDGNPYTDAPVVSPAKAQLLGRIVYQTCDAIDGAEDGIITNPPACEFSPADLPMCEAGGEDCFSPEEVSAIEAIYDGVSVAGQTVVPGIPVGSEAMQGGWTSWLIASPDAPKPPLPLLHTIMADSFNYLMFEEDNPDYNYMRQFDFETDPGRMDAAAQRYNATDPDIADVAERGARIILYHGWGDPGANPLNTISYYEAVRETLADDTGAPDPDSFLRLYMMPGMGHCRGGVGHDQADWLDALSGWVEEGEAPEAVVATRVSDGATRPLCPYPQQSRYSGSGDLNAAESFTCVASD